MQAVRLPIGGEVRRGFCGLTRAGGSCEYDSRGSWSLRRLGLPSSAPHRNKVARRLCTAACSGCRRCSFVSMSVEANDCSWFNVCNLSATKTTYAGWHSWFVQNRMQNLFLTPIDGADGKQRWQPPPELATWATFGFMEPLSSSLLLGCRRIFLDLGSNVGETLEALYTNSAAAASASGAARAFASFFGRVRDDVCTLAFEPSPLHARRLAALVSRLRTAGRRIHLFHAAIADSNGVAPFFSDGNGFRNEWAASLVRGSGGGGGGVSSVPQVRVPTVSFSWLLKKQIPLAAARWTPSRSMASGVMVKMDIELEEYIALPPAISSGVLCGTVDALAIEVHKPNLMDAAGRAKAARLVELLGKLDGMRRRDECRTRVLQIPRNEAKPWNASVLALR